MNNLEDIKQRFISALDKSDTPKEFIFNIFEEVYQQGYEDGISVIEQIKAEIKEQHDYHFSDHDEDIKHGLRVALEIISKHIKEYEA